MERPLRLIPSSPVEELARNVEALLVVSSQPLAAEDLAAATEDDRERVEEALELLGARYAEGRSGIVLEHVAGGWAFRASRDAATARTTVAGKLIPEPPPTAGTSWKTCKKTSPTTHDPIVKYAPRRRRSTKTIGTETSRPMMPASGRPIIGLSPPQSAQR